MMHGMQIYINTIQFIGLIISIAYHLEVKSYISDEKKVRTFNHNMLQCTMYM